MTRRIDAVTFDFFNTLVRHRDGRGRGATSREYLRAHGFSADAWDNAVLDDVFALHGREFAPDAGAEQHGEFCVRMAGAFFRRMRIDADREAIARHAPELWRILGPEAFAPFPDSRETLIELRAAGYRLAIVSNWHCGLAAFVAALGLGGLVDHVVASAEVGWEKPDSRIFAEACHRLGVSPDRVLHVGDSSVEDRDGARAAGLDALLLENSCRGLLSSLRSRL